MGVDVGAEEYVCPYMLESYIPGDLEESALLQLSILRRLTSKGWLRIVASCRNGSTQYAAKVEGSVLGR